MKTVQPIRNPEDIRKMEQILKSQSERNYILFRLGVNSGLRISDILNLKVKHVKNQTHFNLKEQKTSKSNRIKINPKLKLELDSYIKGMNDEEYLFKSREGSNSPIQRMQAWRILNKAASEIGLTEIGTHTLRKTFGYHMYKQCSNIEIVQKFLNHSSPHVTLAYIGITQDSMDDLIDNCEFAI